MARREDLFCHELHDIMDHHNLLQKRCSCKSGTSFCMSLLYTTTCTWIPGRCLQRSNRHRQGHLTYMYSHHPPPCLTIPSPTNNAPLHRTIGAGYVTAIHFLSPAALDDSLEYFHPLLELDLSPSPPPTHNASSFTFTADLPNQRDNVVNGPT